MPDSSRIEIFRDRANLYTRLRPRTRLILGVVLLFAVALAGNAWWLFSSLSRPSLEEELEEHARTQAMRVQAMERVRARAGEIREGVAQLQENDAKLRAMIHLDKEARHAAQGVGGHGQAGLDPKTLLTRLEVQSAYVRALDRGARLVRADGALLEQALATMVSPLGAAPDAWPVQGVVSSEFGVRLSPFAGQEEFHKGVDIMAPLGTAVRAPAPGVVAFAGEDAEGALTVVVDHGGGYVTTFSHLQRMEVRSGEALERGRVLGTVGQEGRSTGPHLHYEVRLHGAPLDPRKFLP